jgi:hypothetical protein
MVCLRTDFRHHRAGGGYVVLCDESGHTKFPLSFLAPLALLTLAQARLSLCSGLLSPRTIFGRLRSI